MLSILCCIVRSSLCKDVDELAVVVGQNEGERHEVVNVTE
jgi:hypothetical protein